MKRILILLLVVFAASYAQGQTVVQRAGAANTVNDPRHMASLNSFQPRYADTAAANAQKGIDSSGAVIYTYDVKGFWLRQHNPKRWVRLADATNIEALYNNINNAVTVVNDSTLVVCATLTGACDTLTVATHVTNIASTTYLSDTTIRVCSALGDCDTLVIPQPVPYTFQNGLNTAVGPATVEFGGTLGHNTTLNTQYYTQTFVGYPVYDYPYKFQQTQAPGLGDIVSFHQRNKVYDSLGVMRSDYFATLGVHFTDSVNTFGNEGGAGEPRVNGIMGAGRVGYFVGTNLKNHGAFGQYAEDTTAKATGIFFHTNDRASTEGVSLYAVPPSAYTAGAGTEKALAMGALPTYVFLTGHTTGDVTLPHYPSSRNDGVLSKVLGTDAAGNVLLGTIGAYSTTDTSGRTYYALNGLSARNDSTFKLGGYLDENTLIKGNNTYGLSTDSTTYIAHRVYDAGYSMTMEVGGDMFKVEQTYLADTTRRNRFYWNTQNMYFDNHQGAYYFSNLVSHALAGGQYLVGIDEDTQLFKINSYPEYTDNAAALAAGLPTGSLYHTAGALKVVYTP